VLLEERSRTFAERLEELRAGDRGRTGELLDLADALCREHARCDAVDIVRYYCSLSDAGLARGLELDLRYGELYREVAAASELRDGAWYELRDRVLGDLDALVAEAGRAEDGVPAARARSLAARLIADRLEGEGAETPEEGAALLVRALDLAERGLAVFRDAGMRRPTLEPLWTRGRLERLAGRRVAARRSLEACLAEAEAVGAAAWSSRALRELLRLAREAGDVHHQDRLLARLAAVRSPEESWPLVREYAEWILQRDHADEARTFLARYPASEGSDAVDWRVLAGSAALRAGDEEAAREHVAWLEEHEGGEAALLSRARLLLSTGRPEEVVAELGGGGLALGFGPHGEAMGTSMLGEAELALGDPDAAAAHLERALELAERWREALGTGEHNVFGEWVGVHTIALLARAHADAGRPLEAALVAERYQSRALREACGAEGPVGEDELLDAADGTSLGLVTWVVGADSALVAHVAPRGRADVPEGVAWAAPIAAGRGDLRRAGRRLREAVLADDAERAERLAREVADVLLPSGLVARLEALASRDSPERLLALAHGPLEAMPLELVLEVAGVDAALLVLPGLRGEVDRAPIDRPEELELGGWTLVAGDAGKTELPAARAEVEALLALHPDARAVEGPGATDAMREALSAGRPLHLATHLAIGCGCDETRLAPRALRLPDGGTLCAHEVARLRPASPLVVLSACETGGGRYVDSEGLYGLARAFLESGTRNVAVTLWPVEDGAARDFAVAFHGALVGGALPSEAARAGREALRAAGAGPADWAAFRLVGRD
jgi:hypothetical protein